MSKGFEEEQAKDTTPAEPLHLQSDDLSSDKGINYIKLRDLLAAGKWKEADYETYVVMLQAVSRKEKDWLRDGDLLNFKRTDLSTIDRLWVKYSNGHFGFSVQKKIYLSVGGKPDGKYYKEAWEKFGDIVEWRVTGKWIFYQNVNFDISAPCGHLPVFVTPPRDGWVWRALFSRIDTYLESS